MSQDLVSAGNLIRTYDRVLTKVMTGLLNDMKQARAEKNYGKADRIRQIILDAEILLRVEDETVKWMVSGASIGGEV